MVMMLMIFFMYLFVICIYFSVKIFFMFLPFTNFFTVKDPFILIHFYYWVLSIFYWHTLDTSLYQIFSLNYVLPFCSFFLSCNKIFYETKGFNLWSPICQFSFYVLYFVAKSKNFYLVLDFNYCLQIFQKILQSCFTFYYF